MRRVAPVRACLVAVVLVAGCSSAGHTPSASSGPAPRTREPAPSAPAIDCPSAVPAFGRDGAGRDVHTSQSGTPGLTTCLYRVTTRRAGRCPSAKVTIDTAPSALTDFNRWVDETEQNSTANGTPARAARYAPHAIAGVGLLADWVPARRTFETALSDRWVSVFLACPDHAVRALALAKALARAGLAA